MKCFLKTHGGKHYLAKWIISHFPQNYTSIPYFEPFLGGGSVLLQKEKSVLEFCSDIELDTITVWWGVKYLSPRFIDTISNVEYSEETFNRATNNEFCMAANKFIKSRMSRGGLEESFAWSDRLRGGIPGDVNAWNNVIRSLPDISKRLYGVRFYNSPYQVSISYMDFYYKKHNDVFVYCDPPYLPSTRTAKKCYKNEMTEDDHKKLCETLVSLPFKIMISGYYSELYSTMLKGWRMESKSIVNHSGQNIKKEKRVECIWMNYA